MDFVRKEAWNNKMVLRIKQIVVLLLLFQLLTFPSTNCIYRTNTEPLQTGLIFSLPYDIANTLRAPLAGPLSLILTAGLALVMFFGILISPITYIFGYPSRNYYIHDAIKDSVWNNWGFDEVQRSLRRNTRKKRSFLVQNSSDFLEFPEFKAKYYESNSNNHAIIRNATLLEGKERIYPKFHESTFSFIPNQDRHCQLLLICHAHGYLAFCPSGFIRFYNFLR